MDDIQFSEFLDESIPLWRNDPVMFVPGGAQL